MDLRTESHQKKIKEHPSRIKGRRSLNQLIHVVMMLFDDLSVPPENGITHLLIEFRMKLRSQEAVSYTHLTLPTN